MTPPQTSSRATSTAVSYTMADFCGSIAAQSGCFFNDNLIMSIGSTRPLIDALRIACVDLINWLMTDYGFDKIEATQLLGQAAQLEIANVVDPQYSVACQVDKKYLPR